MFWKIALLIQDKVYGRFLREDQIGNAGLAWSTEDSAGNPERGIDRAVDVL